MGNIISEQALKVQEECDITLQHVVNMHEGGTIEEVYDIVQTSESEVPLTLVVMHHRNEEPMFVVTHGITQIPCPGLHTSEQIDGILMHQKEFPLPMSCLTRNSMHQTVSYSKQFIEDFRSMSWAQ